MTSPAPIPTERLIKLSKLRGDKFQEEAAMARELLALRQSSPPDGQAADGWIEWKGGECPVSPDTEVYWRRRSEEGKPTADMEREFKPAADLRWSHRSASSDIIAYRIIPTTKAPGEEH
jgi:hypothetical protein